MDNFNSLEQENRNTGAPIAVIDNSDDYNPLDIKQMIHVIRGQQVMLDTDLALLYGYEVKALNQQVKRNIERFPKDFMFQLTTEELPESLKSQIVTLNNQGNKRGLHIKKLPYAFTEQGIYMLATVLKGTVAIEQSIMIMRTFKEMRHYLIENQGAIIPNYNYDPLLFTSLDHERRLNTIENTLSHTTKQLDKIMDNFVDEKKMKEYIFLNGQQFTADEAYIKIYEQALHSIYIIDDYISIKTLSHLKHKKENIEVILFSDNKGHRDQLREPEFNDFNSEYPSLKIIRNEGIIHDRYIIIDYHTDHEKAYLCGASSKDAGKKICTIIELESSQLIYPIVNQLMTHDEYQYNN